MEKEQLKKELTNYIDWLIKLSGRSDEKEWAYNLRDNYLQSLEEQEEKKKSTIIYGEKCDKCGFEFFHEDDACPNCGSFGTFTEIGKPLEDLNIEISEEQGEKTCKICKRPLYESEKEHDHCDYCWHTH